MGRTYVPCLPTRKRVAFPPSVRGMVGDLRWVGFDLVDLDTVRGLRVRCRIFFSPGGAWRVDRVGSR